VFFSCGKGLFLRHFIYQKAKTPSTIRRSRGIVIPIPILAPGERSELEASDAVPEVDAGPSVGDGLPLVVCEPVFWLPVGLEVMGVDLNGVDEVTSPDDEVVGGDVVESVDCEEAAPTTKYAGVCAVVWLYLLPPQYRLSQ